MGTEWQSVSVLVSPLPSTRGPSLDQTCGEWDPSTSGQGHEAAMVVLETSQQKAARIATRTRRRRTAWFIRRAWPMPRKQVPGQPCKRCEAVRFSGKREAPHRPLPTGGNEDARPETIGAGRGSVQGAPGLSATRS